MSMGISNSYGNDYASTCSDVKKESDKSSEIRKSTRESNQDNVRKYYEKLCKKFPDIRFYTSGGISRCSNNKVVVNLSYDCLKKMAGDPEFAKKMEWNLSGEAAANRMVYACAKRDGVELGGRTVIYDADGNRQSSCGGMRTANKRTGSHSVKKQSEERLKKVQKRREKKAQAEKYLAEALTDRGSISAVTNSMESVVQPTIFAMSANTGADIAGFDVKA